MGMPAEHQTWTEQELLRNAAARPLAVEVEERDGQSAAGYPRPLIAWVQHLRETYPLWSLAPHAYAAMTRREGHEDEEGGGDSIPELPSTYPLRPIVRSIIEDEAPRTDRQGGMFPPPLVSQVDHRRTRLITEERPTWSRSAGTVNAEGELDVLPVGSRLLPSVLDLPLLAEYEQDDEEGGGGYVSPYEEIGLELVHHVEDERAAPPGPEKREASQRLQAFLAKVAKRVPGRPAILDTQVAARLVQEGTELLGVARKAIAAGPVELTPEFKDLGDPEDDTPPEEWALRLVLPVLSWLELKELVSRSRKGAESPKHNTPQMDPDRALAIEIVAHRIRSPASYVARKVETGWVTEKFASKVCAICGHKHGGEG